MEDSMKVIGDRRYAFADEEQSQRKEQQSQGEGSNARQEPAHLNFHWRQSRPEGGHVRSLRSTGF